MDSSQSPDGRGPATPSARATVDGTPGRTVRRGARVNPLYHQLYVLLREQLLAGTFPSGEAMPSEPDLSERYEVSRVTIRKTLHELEKEGLIRRVRGLGTFPSVPAEPQGPVNISGILENLISFDRRTDARNLSWERIQSDAELRDVFGSDPVLRVVRLRSYMNQPMSLTTLIVPASHADRIDPDAGPAVPLIQLLEAKGVIAERNEQAITAVAAHEEAATALGVAPGAPLIAMRRLMFDADSAPVLQQESLYTPDRFEYRMTLSRTTVGPVARWTPRF